MGKIPGVAQGLDPSRAVAAGVRMEQFAAVVLVAMLLATGSALLHYEALRGISYLLPVLSIPPRRKILLIIYLGLLAHFLEIALFAAGISLFLDPGAGIALPAGVIDEAVYISFESFASLGTSAGYPMGPLRLLAGVEALVGLILIGWTTTFTFIAMKTLWDDHST